MPYRCKSFPEAAINCPASCGDCATKSPSPSISPSLSPTIAPAPPTVPPTIGNVRCGDPHTSGWGTYGTYAVDISTSAGWVTVQYNMFTIADQLKLIYEGKVIFDSGVVTGSNKVERFINGASSILYVKMTGIDENVSTKWQFIVNCRLSDGSQVC